MRIPDGIVRVWRGLPDEGGKFQGTAFFVEPTRALTAAHVIEGATEKPLYLFLSWNGGLFARVAAQVMHDDRTNVDVALLSVDEQFAAPGDALVPLGDPLPISVGAPLIIAGFADPHAALERRSVAVTSLEGAATAAIIYPPPAPGMSGGPAFSPDGFLRGINWASDKDPRRGRGYITPFTAFRNFLAEQGVRGAARRLTIIGDAVARIADAERLRLARRLLLNWRESYAARVNELTALAAKARALQKSPPAVVSNDVAALIGVAAKVADDLRNLPVRRLEFAKYSGLRVHETVFWGQALTAAEATSQQYGPGISSDAPWLEDMKADGLDLGAPDAYAYEMLARVLESAVGLAGFPPKNLPLGYASTGGSGNVEDLSGLGPLMLMRVGDNPSLKLVELGEAPRLRGSFVARGRSLYVHAAQKMADGTLDIFGTDFQFDYRWSASGSAPVADSPREDICAAAFAAAQAEASLIVVATDGAARERFLDGSSNQLAPPLGAPCAVAALWRDPLVPENHYLLRFSEAGTLYSHCFGSDAEGRHSDLSRVSCSDEPDRYARQRLRADELHISELEGFPCVAASLKVDWSNRRVVHFHDPATLQPIRQARYLGHSWAEFRVALGRWLVATRIGRTEPQPLLAVWDLTDASTNPIGQWCVEPGDIYEPLVVRVIQSGGTAFSV
jgi:hypothetical protein